MPLCHLLRGVLQLMPKEKNVLVFVFVFVRMDDNL